MKDLTIKWVETKPEMDDFVRLPEMLYRDCSYYVPDLEMDIWNMFNPKKNAGLEFADIQACSPPSPLPSASPPVWECKS